MNEQTLILYYYRDGLSASELRDVSKALQNDEALARRYEKIARDLDALRETEDLPAPDGLHYRLQSALDRAVRLEESERRQGGSARHSGPWLFAGRGVFAKRSLALGSALAAVLAVGIGIGLWMARGAPTDPTLVHQPVETGAVEWSQAAFQRGLESHFRSSRTNQDGFAADGQQDQAALISALIKQNRMYARLALQNDAADLARVLRSFEPTLLQLAKSDLSPREAADLMAKLEFELTVMLTKLERETSQETEQHNQELKL
jgi:hypothetical protein